MNNETNMEMINEVSEVGTELVTEVTKNNDLLKKVGVGAGFAVAGALVYEGTKRLIGLIKSKSKKKNEVKQPEAETSDETTESVED